MAVSAAARRARSRQREAAGQVCLTIVVDRADLIALLEEAELIDPMSEETRETLATGVQELLKVLIAARDYMPRPMCHEFVSRLICTPEGRIKMLNMLRGAKLEFEASTQMQAEAEALRLICLAGAVHPALKAAQARGASPRVLGCAGASGTDTDNEGSSTGSVHGQRRRCSGFDIFSLDRH